MEKGSSSGDETDAIASADAQLSDPRRNSSSPIHEYDARP